MIRVTLGGFVVLAGAAASALGAAACSLNFDRYSAVVDATGGRPDVGADASPGNDSSADAGPGPDTGGDGPDGSDVDCGPVVQGCASEAGSCGTACGVTSQQCQAQCSSNPCKHHCQQVEQSCRQGCETACASCIGNTGCSSADCADAAFAD
jgi:hypothetical protein